jgi:phage tail-like protein
MTATDFLIEEPDFDDTPANSTGERGLVDGLRTPFPLINAVPPMLAEDPFVQRMMPAFDEVLAPIISTLDCFPSYLDPALAPMDMVTYMASWLFPNYEDQLSEEGLRHALATVVERSGWRGTARGIKEALQTFELASIDITDSGSTVVSTKPTDPSTWPEVAPPSTTITCVAGSNASIDDDQIVGIIRFLVPAHVIVTVEAT